MQCQLGDFQSEVVRLGKSLSELEEQLEEKVMEATRLEAAVAAGSEGEDELRVMTSSLKSAFISVEKENEGLRQQLFRMREEERNRELQVRDRDQERRKHFVRRNMFCNCDFIF
jgi:uncharacterized coiled-coil DUF342 family protein